MKKILLKNKGVYTLVDNEDFKSLNKLRWHLNSAGYAGRRYNVSGKKTNFSMARIVNKTPKHLFVDHINRNKLDNRKKNLRNVTWGENRCNISVHKDNFNKQRNIDFSKRDNLWRVRIQRYYKIVFQDRFDTLRKAVIARNNYYKTGK